MSVFKGQAGGDDYITPQITVHYIPSYLLQKWRGLFDISGRQGMGRSVNELATSGGWTQTGLTRLGDV